MSAELRRFLSRLAIDPEAYGRFIADPVALARDSGLSQAEQDVLVSGDQNRIHAALTADAAEGEAAA